MAKINVLMVKVGKNPELIEIDDSLKTMQNLVGGYIEMVRPFEDENVILVCNEEGKINRLPFNRMLYYTPEYIEMSWKELKEKFREYEKERNYKENPLYARVVFAQKSFGREYSEASRTYEFSSDNKAFQSQMSGYSIFGNAIDGSDLGVRLDYYMADERGGKNGWIIEKCYLLGESKKIMDFISGDFILCGMSYDQENVQRIPDYLILKYKEKFCLK